METLVIEVKNINSDKIIVIGYDEIDEEGNKTGRFVASHGVNMETLENVALPDEPVRSIAKWSPVYEEWILK